MKQKLTIKLLCREASVFAEVESSHIEPTIYGVTDGKAVGTYLEHKFQTYLREKYAYKEGSSARGIDFPKLGVDIKVTSIKQPQFSCPFKNARQKISNYFQCSSVKVAIPACNRGGWQGGWNL